MAYDQRMRFGNGANESDTCFFLDDLLDIRFADYTFPISLGESYTTTYNIDAYTIELDVGHTPSSTPVPGFTPIRNRSLTITRTGDYAGADGIDLLGDTAREQLRDYMLNNNCTFLELSVYTDSKKPNGFEDFLGNQLFVLLDTGTTLFYQIAGLSNKSFIRYYDKPKINMSVLTWSYLDHVNIKNGGTTKTFNFTGIPQPVGMHSIETMAFTLNELEDSTYLFSFNSGATYKDAYIEVDMIPYHKLTCNAHSFVFDVNGDISFIVNGNYYDDPQVFNNTLAVQCRYSNENGVMSEWMSAQPEIVGSNYTASFLVSGAHYQDSYYIEVKATDRLMTVEGNGRVVHSTPTFDWCKTDFRFNVPVNVNSYVSLQNDMGIYGKNTDGQDQIAMTPCDSTGNLTIGYGGYHNENGDTLIYGNNIDIIANHNVTVNGVPLNVSPEVESRSKILWSGVDTLPSWSGENHWLYFNEPVSEQPNGIILVFSLYTNNAPQDASLHSFFVHKKEVELFPGRPHTFTMNINSGFSVIGSKYVYIFDDGLDGGSSNTASGNNSGITFDNNRYVLRYVIGV